MGKRVSIWRTILSASSGFSLAFPPRPTSGGVPPQINLFKVVLKSLLLYSELIIIIIRQNSKIKKRDSSFGKLSIKTQLKRRQLLEQCSGTVQRGALIVLDCLQPVPLFS
eukprot:sb/3477281/